MIARVWTATTRQERAPEYVHHFTQRVLPELASIDGYEGAMLSQRNDAETVEFMLITYWKSEDAIRRFAGTDISRAVIAEEARRMLLTFDEIVKHYAVLAHDA